MEMSEILLLAFMMLGAGLLAGFIGSLLGIGGAMIVTPIITVAFGFDIKYAIGAGIVVVISTSSGAAISYLKDNVINLRVAMFLEIFTTIGGIIGALLTGILAPWILYILFAALILFSVFNMIKKYKVESKEIITYTKNDYLANKLKLNGTYFDKSFNKQIDYKLKNVPLGSAIMLAAGIASGLLGIGSGIFKVIAMDNAMKMPLKPSSATSNLMMGVTAASSAIVYYCNGQILPEIAVPVSLGVLCGAAIGSRLMPKLKPKVLRIIFIPVMLFLSIEMIIKAFTGF